jgi:hypothetical protein
MTPKNTEATFYRASFDGITEYRSMPTPRGSVFAIRRSATNAWRIYTRVDGKLVSLNTSRRTLKSAKSAVRLMARHPQCVAIAVAFCELHRRYAKAGASEIAKLEARMAAMVTCWQYTDMRVVRSDIDGLPMMVESHIAATIEDLSGDPDVSDAEAQVVIASCRDWIADVRIADDDQGDISDAELLHMCNRAIDGGLAFVLADVRMTASREMHKLAWDALEPLKPDTAFAIDHVMGKPRSILSVHHVKREDVLRAAGAPNLADDPTLGMRGIAAGQIADALVSLAEGKYDRVRSMLRRASANAEFLNTDEH